MTNPAAGGGSPVEAFGKRAARNAQIRCALQAEMFEESSREKHLLRMRPNLRDHVAEDPAIVEWRNSLEVVDIDGEQLRVIHGDRRSSQS